MTALRKTKRAARKRSRCGSRLCGKTRFSGRIVCQICALGKRPVKSDRGVGIPRPAFLSRAYSVPEALSSRKRSVPAWLTMNRPLPVRCCKSQGGCDDETTNVAAGREGSVMRINIQRVAAARHIHHRRVPIHHFADVDSIVGNTHIPKYL